MNFTKFTRVLKDTAIYVLTVGPIVFTVNHAIATVAHVEGRSMAPTLNAAPPDATPVSRTKYSMFGIRTESNAYPDVGEMVAIRKLFYKPARGDVVVLASPGKPGEFAVKRLVALEGDVIMYLDPTRKKSLLSLTREMEYREKQEREHKAQLDEFFEIFGRQQERDMDDMQIAMHEVAEFYQRQKEMETNKREETTKESTNETNNTTNTTTKDKNTINTTNTEDENSNYNELINKERELQQNEFNLKLKAIFFEDVELRIVKIPQGHCWVEGDNPEVSRDSKEYGAIPLGLVKGKVEGVIWPPRLARYLSPYHGTTTLVYKQQNNHNHT